MQLAVADLTTSLAFYAGILELPVVRAITPRGAPEHFTISQDGFELVVVEEEAVMQAHPLLRERFEMFPRGVGLTLHFQVKGLREIAEAIEGEDLEIFYPLDRKPFGMQELWCFDPDGYLVVLEEVVPTSKSS